MGTRSFPAEVLASSKQIGLPTCPVDCCLRGARLACYHKVTFRGRQALMPDARRGPALFAHTIQFPAPKLATRKACPHRAYPDNRLSHAPSRVRLIPTTTSSGYNLASRLRLVERSVGFFRVLSYYISHIQIASWNLPDCVMMSAWRYVPGRQGICGHGRSWTPKEGVRTPSRKLMEQGKLCGICSLLVPQIVSRRASHEAMK